MRKYVIGCIAASFFYSGCGKKEYYVGEKGEQGVQGEPGQAGIDGSPGADGKDGGSCEVSSDQKGYVTITCPNTSVTIWSPPGKTK
jgi:hypothetical protein